MTRRRRNGAPPQSWTGAAARMGAVTAVSRAFGFVRVLVVAAVLGSTFLGNAYQSANSVSNPTFSCNSFRYQGVQHVCRI